MTGDRLGQGVAYFRRHPGSGSTPALAGQENFSRPSAPCPRTWRSGGPARNDADLSGLTVEGGHSAMITRLDGGLRFATAIAMHRCQAAPAEA